MAKTIVVTAWGKGETVEKIAICRFKGPTKGNNKSPIARNYCRWMNTLAQGSENWVNAHIVEDGEIIDLKSLLPHPDEWTLLPLFDDRAIQRFMREIDIQDLSRALKISPPEVQEKVFRNLSELASQMLKEDMESIGDINRQDAEEAKQKMISVIRHLEDTGEIEAPQFGDEFVN
ncbi:hypothetical protein FACS189473_0010 [Spirochaetia bacterium]|nr:hypothetical protein FACS189473_0010 [Spirochaetia bacterium]